MLVALMAITSLAVDFGHVEMAKTEIQRAADAAARAAAYQLSGGASQESAALTAASVIAAYNTSDNIPLVVTSSDVVFGNWDSTQTPNFSSSRNPINAVTVTVNRDGVENPAVPLMFTSMLGISSCCVRSSATASVEPPMSSYGIVGINSASFAAVGVVAKIKGNLVSNGSIYVGCPIGIDVSVSGNVQSYGGSVSVGVGPSIGGVTSSLSKSLYYPPAQTPTSNDNALISQYLNGFNDFTGVGVFNLPAGVYVVHDLNLVAGVVVNLQGPVTFYVAGSFNYAAGVNLLGSTNTDPSNFTVKILDGGTVVFLANVLTPIAMNLYAPQSDVAIAVTVTSFKGMIVGKTLTIAVPALSVFTEVAPTDQPPTVTMEK
jgi:Flp pilus assembly protein TadG